MAGVLMTVLSMGLRLLPSVVSYGKPEDEIETPVAIVVLFGVLSSTRLNMAVMPTLFLRWAKAKPPEGLACESEWIQRESGPIVG
jgi:Cu/Ag efflux pump CusA